MKYIRSCNAQKDKDHPIRVFLFVLSLFLVLLCPIAVALFPNHTKLIFALSFSLVVFFGVGVVDEHQTQRYIVGILGLSGIVIIWYTFLSVQEWLIWLRLIILFVFVNFISYHIFRQILFHKSISIKIILNSIAGYMLLGFGGGLLCQMIELIFPHSFQMDHVPNLFQFAYFSYSTLITLGFGDMIPYTPPAKSLALIISISGQLYLTILVAMLVGKYLSNGNRSEPYK